MGVVAEKLKQDGAEEAPPEKDESAPPAGAPPAEESAGAAPGEGADPGEEAEDDEPSNVSPEEQALYDATVLAANAMIYGAETGKLVVQRIREEKGSARGIGHIAAMLMMSVREGAKKQGREIPDDVLFAAGQEVVANLVQIAVAAGLASEATEQELFQQAIFEGLKVFGEHEANAGELTLEKRNKAAADLQAFNDQHGEKTLTELARPGALDDDKTEEVE